MITTKVVSCPGQTITFKFVSSAIYVGTAKVAPVERAGPWPWITAKVAPVEQAATALELVQLLLNGEFEAVDGCVLAQCP